MLIDNPFLHIHHGSKSWKFSQEAGDMLLQAHVGFAHRGSGSVPTFAAAAMVTTVWVPNRLQTKASPHIEEKLTNRVECTKRACEQRHLHI